MRDSDEEASCGCKVGRVIDAYRLHDLDGELAYEHQHEEASLRTLADYVNQRVLAASLRAADANMDDALYGAVTNDDALITLYETLTESDVPADRAARVRTRLAQLGVDVESVEDDWVTHPTVRKHLNECLDIDTERSASITIEDARNTVEWARTQSASIVEQSFTRLENAGLLSIGPFDVTVTIQLTCTACGSTYRPSELLDRGKCNCEDAPEPSD